MPDPYPVIDGTLIPAHSAGEPRDPGHRSQQRWRRHELSPASRPPPPPGRAAPAAACCQPCPPRSRSRRPPAGAMTRRPGQAAGASATAAPHRGERHRRATGDRHRGERRRDERRRGSAAGRGAAGSAASCPWLRSTAPSRHPGQPTARPDDAGRQDRHGRRGRLRQRHHRLRRPHRGQPGAVHPRPEPGGRAAGGGRRRARRDPAAGPGGAGRRLGPGAGPRLRLGGRQRGARQGRRREPGPDGEHRPRPALGPGLRELRRGPLPGRADRGRLHRRGAEPGRAVPGEALRRVQPGNQPEHGGRRRHRQPARDARDLPAAVPGGRAAGQRGLGDVQLLHRQRPVRLPEQLPDERAGQRVALPWLRHLGLGRHPLHGAVRAGRPGHEHARRDRLRAGLLRRTAQGGGAGRPGADDRAGRHGVADPHRDVPVQLVRQPAHRVAERDRHHPGARTDRPGRGRGGRRAAEERRRRAAAAAAHRTRASRSSAPTAASTR